MNLHELDEIIARGEDARNQFKEDVRNIDSLASEMVAFSNAKGGRILIGVTNTGIISGLSRESVDRINQLISNAANQHVRSPITVQTENILVPSGRVVILLTVPNGIDKPYFDNHGVIWLKNGSDKRRVNSKEELRRLFQEVDLIHADKVPTRAGIDALNSQGFAEFLQRVYHKKLPKPRAAALQLLENMNLASGDRLNLTGLLLFGEKPQMFKPEFILKAICFPGTTIAGRYADSEDFEGPLPAIFQGALAFIVRNLRKIQNEKNVNSTGDLEIPAIVFEELLVNALIHRDYFVCAPIRLFVFDDRIEIISPGCLPDHLTIEKIQAGNSIQRNPILTSFIAKGLLPYRGLGTGICRALADWPKTHFINDPDGCLFTAVVERVRVKNAPVNAPVNASVNAPVKVALSNLQQEILKIMNKDPQISYEEIASKLNKNRSTIMRNIKNLKERKIVGRVGSDKLGHWAIIDQE